MLISFVTTNDDWKDRTEITKALQTYEKALEKKEQRKNAARRKSSKEKKKPDEPNKHHSLKIIIDLLQR